MQRRQFKWLTIVWALLIGAGLVLLAGSVLLPSTKRARVDWGEVRRLAAEREAAEAASQPATGPVAEPATEPAIGP